MKALGGRLKYELAEFLGPLRMIRMRKDDHTIDRAWGGLSLTKEERCPVS